MARPKRGIIYSLEQVLDELLKTNAALNSRLAQMEAVLIGGARPSGAKRGRKPGKKRGRKPSAAKSCSEPGCKRPHYAKGLCASHYQSSRRVKTEKKADKKA
jgi:hypothetical protein